MAQNFRRYTENNVGTSAVDIPDGSNFDSYDFYSCSWSSQSSS